MQNPTKVLQQAILLRDGTYAEGIVLRNGQRLIGDGSSGGLTNALGAALPPGSVVAAGVAIYNGSFTVTQAVIASSSGASVDQTFKGRIEVQGAFNDFIEADVKQSVSVTGLSSSSGAVSMKLVGTIKTSEGTNTFNEDVNVTAGGQIAVAASK